MVKVQDVTIQRVKLPTTSTKRSDGLRPNLHNRIPNVIEDLSVVEKLRTAIKKFSSVKLHSTLPASNDVCKVYCIFGDVPKGSMLSYQQRVKPSNSLLAQSHNTPLLPPKILLNHRLEVLLGHEDVLREIKNNAYANFWGG